VLNATTLLTVKYLPLRVFSLLWVLLAGQLIASQDRTEGLLVLIDSASLFGLLVYFMRLPKAREPWLWLGLVVGVSGAVGGFFFNHFSDALPYINKNAYSHVPLTALLAVCLSYPSAAGRPRTRQTLLALGLINFAWVFLSASRGSVAVAAVGIAYLFFVMRDVWKITTLVLLGSFLVVIAAQRFPIAKEAAVHGLANLVDEERTMAGRTSGRSDLAIAGWKSFLRHPLGIGTGSFGSTFAVEGSRYVQSFTGAEMQAHSGWVKVLAENGFLGFAAMLGFVASFVTTGWREHQRGVFPLALFVAGGISVAWLSTEFQSKYVWFLAAAGMVLLHPDHEGVAALSPRTAGAQRRHARLQPNRR
jgi:hypothetical protein